MLSVSWDIETLPSRRNAEGGLETVAKLLLTSFAGVALLLEAILGPLHRELCGQLGLPVGIGASDSVGNGTTEKLGFRGRLSG